MSHKRQLTLTASLLLLSTLTLVYCARAQDDVKFESAETRIKDKSFTLEIADNPPRRELGLMNRDAMAADHGMIFVFDKPGIYAFWMKNTKLALDLVYLDASGKIVGIYNLKPLDETPVNSEKEALYALELNAGTAKTLGLKTGDTISLPEKVLKTASRSDEK